ncbi:MAG: hypothetical protein WA821_14680 [Anaerolineales bacterium]
MSTETSLPCDACDQATAAAALTQQKNDDDAQAAATALIMRAKAQATLNSANATLGAAQTQAQDAANLIAAQVAATALIVRANAQATLSAAEATQNAAQTQDAIRQTQTAAASTGDAQALLDQQNKDRVAAGTQTAIANVIATQTQSAVATSQWYADQDRKLQAQQQGSITFILMLCVPVFLVLLAGLILWGLWRWVKIQQGPRILENPVEKLPAPPKVTVVDHRQDASALYLDGNVVDHHPQLTKPEDQVGRWMDEVKDELRSSDEKDKDDRPDV